MSYRVYFSEVQSNLGYMLHFSAAEAGAGQPSAPSSVKRLIRPAGPAPSGKQPLSRPAPKGQRAGELRSGKGSPLNEEHSPLTTRYANQGWGRRP